MYLAVDGRELPGALGALPLGGRGLRLTGPDDAKIMKFTTLLLLATVHGITPSKGRQSTIALSNPAMGNKANGIV